MRPKEKLPIPMVVSIVLVKSSSGYAVSVPCTLHTGKRNKNERGYLPECEF